MLARNDRRELEGPRREDHAVEPGPGPSLEPEPTLAPVRGREDVVTEDRGQGILRKFYHPVSGEISSVRTPDAVEVPSRRNVGKSVWFAE